MYYTVCICNTLHPKRVGDGFNVMVNKLGGLKKEVRRELICEFFKEFGHLTSIRYLSTYPDNTYYPITYIVKNNTTGAWGILRTEREGLSYNTVVAGHVFMDYNPPNILCDDIGLIDFIT